MTQDNCTEIARLSERKLTGRELARYIWDRAHNRPQCFEQDIAQLIINERAAAAKRAATPPADMEGAREQVIEGLVAAICDPECPTQFTPLLMEARKMLASVSALQRGGWQPIETAPKDGTYVLVTNGTFVDVSRWYAGSFGGFQKLDDSLYWMPLPAAPVVADQRGEQ